MAFTAMVAVAARALPPPESSRASLLDWRMINFTLQKPETFRSELDMLKGVDIQRNELLSDYAALIQKTLSIPCSSVSISDTNRMPDFARVAERASKVLDGVPSGTPQMVHPKDY